MLQYFLWYGTGAGGLRVELFLLLLLAWVIVYLSLWRGVALTGQIVYLTASVPCLLLLAFAVRGVTLPGADQGLLFFFRPDWSRILDPKVWVNAASQVQCTLYRAEFFSIFSTPSE